MGRTDDGRAFRTLNILDEFSRECPKPQGAIRVKRKLNSTSVIDALTDLFILRGPPAFIRPLSLIAPQSTAGQGTTDPSSLLDGEIFYSLKKAQIIIEDWRKLHNTKRPRNA